MSDLNTQLRTYIEEIDPPFDPNTLMREANPATGPGKVTYRRLTPALVFVAAFILVLGAGAVLVLLRTPGSVEPAGPINEPTQTSIPSSEPTTEPPPATTTPPLPTTESVEDFSQLTYSQGIEAVALAETFYETVNSGDLAAAFTLYQPDYQTRQHLSLAVEGLNVRIEHDCTLEGNRIRCAEASTDDLYGPAGLTHSSVTYYRFDNGRLLSNRDTPNAAPWCTGDPTGPFANFLIDLRVWSAKNHPELETHWLWGEPIDSPLAIPCTAYPFRTPAAARQITPIIPEFLEQSDQWPTPDKAIGQVEPPEGVIEIDLPNDLVLWVYPDQPTSAAFREDELIFTLTHSCGECFGNGKEMFREPNGVLSAEGWQGGVWTVNNNQQTEINRLWPPDTPFNMDVLWLTDYTGITADTLTGYTPDPGTHFTLHDELVLEPRGNNIGNFGLQADCSAAGGDIAAALLSFEGPQPVPLIGWTINYQTMSFEQVDDPATLTIGDCLTAEPRSAD